MQPVILLVEPNPVFNRKLKNMLRDKFIIIEKADPYEAINWIENCNVPELIICASQINGFFGPDFIKIVRSYFHKNAVPIWMTTAQMHYGERAEAMRSGANAYFPLASGRKEMKQLLKFYVKHTFQNESPKI